MKPLAFLSLHLFPRILYSQELFVVLNSFQFLRRFQRLLTSKDPLNHYEQSSLLIKSPFPFLNLHSFPSELLIAARRICLCCRTLYHFLQPPFTSEEPHNHFWQNVFIFLNSLPFIKQISASINFQVSFQPFLAKSVYCYKIVSIFRLHLFPRILLTFACRIRSFSSTLCHFFHRFQPPFTSEGPLKHFWQNLLVIKNPLPFLCPFFYSFISSFPRILLTTTGRIRLFSWTLYQFLQISTSIHFQRTFQPILAHPPLTKNPLPFLFLHSFLRLFFT